MEVKRNLFTLPRILVAVIVLLSVILVAITIRLIVVSKQKSELKSELESLYAQSGCPQNYVLNSVSNMCVRLVSEGKTWYEAWIYCLSQGDTLAQFKTADSVEWLRNYVKNDAPSEWRRECNWVGLSHNDYVGWLWVDGSTMDTFLWDYGQPDESNGASCGCDCSSNDSQDGGLHDCRCSLRSVYSICERPLACPEKVVCS